MKKIFLSKGIVPLLEDEVAESFIHSLKESKLKAYLQEQKEETDAKIEEIFIERKNR